MSRPWEGVIVSGIDVEEDMEDLEALRTRRWRGIWRDVVADDFVVLEEEL